MINPYSQASLLPRPKTKSELLSASAASYTELYEILDSLSARQQMAPFPFEHRDKNIRDVLAHLHEWQTMLLSWYEIGMAGLKPDMPAQGYTWKTTPALNAEIWSKYQETSLDEIRQRLDASHEAIQRIMASHSDDELFTRRHYAWTGTTSLGSYLTSATSSHYQWALSLLRRLVRSL